MWVSCWLEAVTGSRKLKALMTGPSGRDHKLSQLAAERLVLNFDPACCTFIRQRDLILFIRPSVAYSLLSTGFTITQASKTGQGHKRSNYTSAFCHLEVRDEKRVFVEDKSLSHILLERQRSSHHLVNFTPLDINIFIILSRCGLYFKSMWDVFSIVLACGEMNTW